MPRVFPTANPPHSAEQWLSAACILLSKFCAALIRLLAFWMRSSLRRSRILLVNFPSLPGFLGSQNPLNRASVNDRIFKLATASLMPCFILSDEMPLDEAKLTRFCFATRTAQPLTTPSVASTAPCLMLTLAWFWQNRYSSNSAFLSTFLAYFKPLSNAKSNSSFRFSYSIGNSPSPLFNVPYPRKLLLRLLVQVRLVRRAMDFDRFFHIRRSILRIREGLWLRLRLLIVG